MLGSLRSGINFLLFLQHSENKYPHHLQYVQAGSDLNVVHLVLGPNPLVWLTTYLQLAEEHLR